MGHKAYLLLIPACHVVEQLTLFSVWRTGTTSTAITPPGSVFLPPLSPIGHSLSALLGHD